MDLPTYTNIWRIEKRLYKLYDLRLPMPLPLVQIGVFVGVFVPWVLLLMLVGAPFEPPWHVLYLVPPGVVTWLATRPVIEGKRLTELLLSQARYLSEPRTWCRLTPIREPREVVVVARIWHRRGDRTATAAPAAATAAATAPARAAVRAQRKTRKTKGHPAVVPVHHARPQPPAAAAPASDVKVAGRPAAPQPSTRAAKSWRRTMPRDISHESDAPPLLPSAPQPPAATPDPATLERPPATPRLETPPPAPPAPASAPWPPASSARARPPRSGRPWIPPPRPSPPPRTSRKPSRRPLTPPPPERPPRPPHAPGPPPPRTFLSPRRRSPRLLPTRRRPPSRPMPPTASAGPPPMPPSPEMRRQRTPPRPHDRPPACPQDRTTRASPATMPPPRIFCGSPRGRRAPNMPVRAESRSRTPRCRSGPPMPALSRM
ncbi:conjugal transfer protein [Thermomonospora amylolytica]|uniref:conjugal transfer protein n=1 Tax=Thermomonospora amylolytica TaxID=1411117 RepID=UPI0013001985|nr:TcpE family conjugal transfer membrane protein [Thermomonospora amylolytica]